MREVYGYTTVCHWKKQHLNSTIENIGVEQKHDFFAGLNNTIERWTVLSIMKDLKKKFVTCTVFLAEPASVSALAKLNQIRAWFCKSDIWELETGEINQNHCKVATSDPKTMLNALIQKPLNQKIYWKHQKVKRILSLNPITTLSPSDYIRVQIQRNSPRQLQSTVPSVAV